MVDVFLVSVTVLSLIFASVMGVITWRVLRRERRRSDARVADLVAAAEARDSPDPLWTDLVLDRTAEARLSADEAALPDLFKEPAATTRNGRRLTLAIALGASAMLVGFAALLAFSQPGFPGLPASAPPAPLELMALDHARIGTRLSIHGLVRNPSTGRAVHDLLAVVLLFDRDGRYLGATQAPVVEPELRPGRESAFDIPVNAGPNVARYRLSFQIAETPVPHVDRRSSVVRTPPAATRAAVVRQASLDDVPADSR